jgi:hypothetical protein
VHRSSSTDFLSLDIPIKLSFGLEINRTGDKKYTIFIEEIPLVLDFEVIYQTFDFFVLKNVP